MKVAKKPTLADSGPFQVFWGGKAQDPHAFEGFKLVGAGQIRRAVGLGRFCSLGCSKRLMEGQQSLGRAWGPTNLLPTMPGLKSGVKSGRENLICVLSYIRKGVVLSAKTDNC